MATYLVRNGRVMAKVKLKPFKARTKTFGSRADAEVWAAEQESEIRFIRDNHGGDTELITKTRSKILRSRDILGLPKIDLKAGAIGIYFLFKKKQCVYVGQSKRIHMRVHEHRHTKRHLKDFDSYTWINCTAGRLDALERFYIKELLPILNTTFTEKNIPVAKARAATRRMRRARELQEVLHENL